MTTNRRFISIFLAQDSIDFGEEFRQFSPEEQDDFVDFLADILSTLMRMFKDLPLDMKVEAVIEGMKMIPPESRAILADFLIQQEEG